MADRRLFIRLPLALMAGAGAWRTTQAQAARPDTARIIVGFPAGGTVDVLGRHVADRLRGGYARAVLVDNKPGAAGQIGIMALRDSAPDGATLLLTPSSMLSIYPYTYPTLRYSVEDVAPVSLGAYMDHGVAVGPAVPASVRTLGDFVAWAKGHPDRANFGSPGAGSMAHMVGILLGQSARLDWRHVAYRGAAPAIQDLLGGQISAYCGPAGDFIAHAPAGRLRVLAIAGGKRSSFFPEAPTLSESGHALALREWYGLFLPARTSPATVDLASAAVRAALGSPDLIEQGRQHGLEIQSSTPQELQALLQADVAQWRGLVQRTGFTAES